MYYLPPKEWSIEYKKGMIQQLYKVEFILECFDDLWRGKDGQVLDNFKSHGKTMLLNPFVVTIFHQFPVHEI